MDDMDFSTLAARMSAGLDGVRACLILSSDGLSLGAYPESGEQRAREVWDHLQEIGDPQRGFVDIGEEIWVLVRRGPYAGVLITAPAVRPGLAIDKLEFLLRAAEEARAREASELSSPLARPEATRRRRTSLHGDKQSPATPAPAPAASTPTPAVSARASAMRPVASEPRPVQSGAAKKVVDVTAERGQPADEPAPPAVDLGPREPAASPKEPLETPTAAATRPSGPDPEVDRVALAREFGRLLAEGG